MTPEQQAAYVTAMAACVAAEIAAMQAANATRAAAGYAQAYDEQAFLDVPLKYGIHHNAVIGMFLGR